MDQLRIVIVGGGIAGLSAAYYLQQLGKKAALELDITVIEGQTHWGGKINTLRKQGFLIEEGPDSFLVSKPWALELCGELHIADDLVSTGPAKHRTYVLSDGELVPLPGGLERMLPADFGELFTSPLFSLGGKLRMLLECLLPARKATDEESLEHLIRRRLGREAYEKMFEPLMAGVYGADGGYLSASAILPHLHALEAEHGSLLRGARHLRRRGHPPHQGGSSSVFMAPRGGMGALVERLVTRLESSGVRLLSDSAVEDLSKARQGFDLSLKDARQLAAQVVILAVPAHAAAKLVTSIDTKLAEELGQIPFASATTVSLAYEARDVPRALDAYGYLVPRREQRDALACTWVSTKFPDRNPKDAALFRLFFNQAGPRIGKKTETQEYVDLARQELHDTLGIEAAPRLAHVSGWRQAMPQYTIGHFDRLSRIESRLAGLQGIFLAGNSYRGVGIPDTVHQSEKIASRVLDWSKGFSKEIARQSLYEH